MLYLWLLAPFFLRDRQPPLVDITPRVFSAQLRIKNGSPIAGKPLARAIELVEGAMKVRRILRGKVTLSTLPDVIIEEGDQLLVVDTPAHLREFATVLVADLYDHGHILKEGEELEGDDQHLAEVVVTAGSTLDGRRLAEVNLFDRYRLRLLAFHRGNEKVDSEKLRLDMRVLRAGDILLVQASEVDILRARRGRELLVLDGGELIPKIKRAKTSLTIMTSVVAVAAFGWLPIMMSALMGVIAILLSGCLNWRDVGKAMNAQVILVIVASLALGQAMMETGAAEFIAQLYVAATWGLAPIVILGGLMLMMAILTNLVSNTAAALVGTPIGISIAQQLGLPIEAFVLAVLFGANMSFATPMAYQTNLLVMNAGGYKFNDFIKVGIPLVILMWISLTYLLNVMYLTT
ncbi:MAG: SLC13 family permease [bacterium]